MERLQALAGALVLLASAHRAAAHGRIWEHDAVALVQRTTSAREGRARELAEQATAVEESLNDLLAKRRRNRVPVSLLAVNSSHASSSSRWFEMDDGLLLQKLHDRMKANEEKEQEELAANAEAIGDNGAPNAAAFLHSGAASQATVRKEDAAHWLTQSDIDHYSDDERRLHQLSGELQRVAASIARIASHQREMGVHLGLPDPATTKFEAGEKVELQAGEGKQAGRWVKASIIGPGDRPNTWNVHVPSTLKGSKDMPNVPAMALRKVEDEGTVFQPTEAQYEVGEQAQVQIGQGPMSGQWVKCVIKSKADLPDAYNIYVPSGPMGHRDIPSVPARVLRKAEAKGLFTQYDMDGDGLLSTEEFKVALREKATTFYEESVKSDQLYQDGEEVQVFSMDGTVGIGQWLNCTVMGTGDLANSWNIFIPSAKAGFQYVQNIATDRLRKVGEEKTATEATGKPIMAIPEQAKHEVFLSSGKFKDRWVPCELKYKSDTDDSHTVYIPWGAPDGRSLMPNVPAEKLRKRNLCGTGYQAIFDGDSPGYDHYDRPYNHKETVEDCATDCTRRFSCRSYEWSPSVKECYLNKVLDPALPANGDYLFCRRKEVPTSAAAFWEGPWVGQELEYQVTMGQFNGTWHPCKLVAYGEKPDTYDVLASVAFLGGPMKIANVSGVPVSTLRYAEGKPVPILLENWEPPQGEEGLYVPPEAAANVTNATGAANATVLANSTANGTELVSDADNASNATVAAGPASETAPAPSASAELASAGESAAAAAAGDESAAEAPAEAKEEEKEEKEEEKTEEEKAPEAAQAEEGAEASEAAAAEETAPATEEKDDEEVDEAAEAEAPEAAAETKAEEAAPAEEDLSSLGDIGEDLPDHVFRVNQVAEVKQAGSWVRCRVVGTGSLNETYNLRFLSEAEDGKELQNIPAVAMRRVQRSTKQEQKAVPLDVDGIDGEIGESVELKVYHGPHAGEWVPAVIRGHGSLPDTYNVKVPSVNGQNKLVKDVHAIALRKTDKKVVLGDDTEWPIYEDGERAEVTMPVGPNSNLSYPCVIKNKGAAKNTYDLEVPAFGSYPGAHARVLRKLSAEEAKASLANDDRLAVSVSGTMKLIQGVQADLLPVVSKLVDDRKELRQWQRRTEDWEVGCDHIDRHNIVARLQELANMPGEAVAAAVPEECSLPKWTEEGFAWDQMATCFQASMNTSKGCAACPTRFLMSLADKCVPKCAPLVGQCADEASQTTSKCLLMAGRCLECISGPMETFMDCTEVSQRGGIMEGIGLIAKNGKAAGGSDLQLEAVLHDAMSTNMFLQMDTLARQGLRALLFSWQNFVTKRT